MNAGSADSGIANGPGGPSAPPTLAGSTALALLGELVDRNMILNADMASGRDYPNIKVAISVDWIMRVSALLSNDAGAKR